jgi:glycosyltransferase involved in cell wall biosynthesis
MKKTLAIFSPRINGYSETFIQAHKNLPFNIRYYYGGNLPTELELEYNILELSLKERIKKRLLKGFSFEEKRILFSLRKQKVDCVLAEYGPTACESLKIIQYLNLPLIIHFHGHDTSEKNVVSKYKEKYKEAFEYARTVIAVSNRMKHDLLNLGCPENKIVLNCYGPNNLFFSLKPDFKNQQFISVGRFVDKKAPHLTIKAFKKVVNEFSEAKLIMVGEGELLNVCKTLVWSWNLQNNIAFTGALKPNEIKILFESSIAFFQHSVTALSGDSEGTPVAILEAQAAGLPVISTYHAGIPDVVIDGETGLLVQEHDVDGMAHNMLRLLKENGLAKQLGQAGRKRVKENFTIEKHLGILQKEIEKTIIV